MSTGALVRLVPNWKLQQLGLCAIIMALTSRAMAPERRAFGMAVFYSAMYPITALAPIGGGWLYDLSGNVMAPLALGITLFAMTLFTYAAFRLMERRWVV